VNYKTGSSYPLRYSTRNFVFKFVVVKLNEDCQKFSVKTRNTDKIEHEGRVFLTRFSGIHFLPVDDSANLGKTLHLETLLLSSTALKRSESL